MPLQPPQAWPSHAMVNKSRVEAFSVHPKAKVQYQVRQQLDQLYSGFAFLPPAFRLARLESAYTSLASLQADLEGSPLAPTLQGQLLSMVSSAQQQVLALGQRALPGELNAQDMQALLQGSTGREAQQARDKLDAATEVAIEHQLAGLGSALTSGNNATENSSLASALYHLQELQGLLATTQTSVVTRGNLAAMIEALQQQQSVTPRAERLAESPTTELMLTTPLEHWLFA